jgi:IS30 family transposase
LASSRRVKKGPGRRPQSAKRQRFMELRARGWSVRAAAREVGVSRSSGTNWSRGYKTYRNGVVVGFVEPLDRLAVREVSARYLSQDERNGIADLRLSGLSVRAIGEKLVRGTRLVVQLIRPRRFEPWSCELRDRIGGRPERFELCGADVTEVAVPSFDVVEVVDVIGHGGG